MGTARTVTACIAVLGLVACIALRLATFAGVPSETLYDGAGLLHICVLATAVLAVGLCRLPGAAARPIRGARIVAPAVIGVAYCMVQVILGRTVLDMPPGASLRGFRERTTSTSTVRSFRI